MTHDPGWAGGVVAFAVFVAPIFVCWFLDWRDSR